MRQTLRQIVLPRNSTPLDWFFREAVVLEGAYRSELTHAAVRRA
jgi:hypothetical protein